MNVNILEIGALAAALVGFGLLYYLHRRRVNFGIRTLVGTAIGVVIGLIFRENYTYVAAFGSIYAGALQAFVVPLLLFSVISSITNLGESIRLQKVGLKSVLFLLLNTFTASVLTLAAAVGLGIGRGFNYTLDAETQAAEVPTRLLQKKQHRLLTYHMPNNSFYIQYKKRRSQNAAVFLVGRCFSLQILTGAGEYLTFSCKICSWGIPFCIIVVQ